MFPLCHSLGSFYHKCLLNFIENFFAPVEMIIWFLFFCLLAGVSQWFVDTGKSLHPWDKAHLIIVYDPFHVFWGLVFCWGFLRLCSSVILACSFLFSDIFVWFWYQGGGGLISSEMSSEMFLPLQFFGIVSEDRYSLLCKPLVEFTCEAVWSWTFCWEFLNKWLKNLCTDNWFVHSF